MSGHAHDWRLVRGAPVIDTLPPELPYRCECGAFTHDPATGAPCPVCDPGDYERRVPATVRERVGA